MGKPTNVESFNEIVDTTSGGYSYRTRSSLKAPTPFPVTSSPPRSRSTKRISKNYKTTSTVTMPTSNKRVNQTSPPPAPKLTAEQKAAIRAIRLEARRFARSRPYVPKSRAKRSKPFVLRRNPLPEPVQVLTFTEDHVKAVMNDTLAGGWLAKGYRWYTSLVGFSVFTPVAK